MKKNKKNKERGSMLPPPFPMTKQKGRLWDTVFYGGGLALVVLLFFVDPVKVGFYPRCPFLVATGYRCPGCGSSRAIHSISHGDIVASWHYNPALLPAVFLIVLLLIAGMLKQKSKFWGRVHIFLSKPVFIYALGASIMLWWLLRNVFGL